MNDHRFAIVTRDDLYALEDRALLECRLAHGSAIVVGRQISARDDCEDALLQACDEEAAAVRSLLDTMDEGRARVVVSARVASDGIDGVASSFVASTIGLTIRDLSIVTTREHLVRDYELLVDLGSVSPESEIDYHRLRLPLVWRNGSAAVLLHEAAGHAAEHGHASISWPPWLHVTDEPGDLPDDTGNIPARADLLAGECPTAFRRGSFNDVPLQRMTKLVVRQNNAPATLPRRRIDVLLLAGGAYDALAQTVNLYVSAADLVDGDRSTRLKPFVIRESRATIARAIAAASGEPQRYPGVICSLEGQDVYVGSYAPLLVTEF